MKKILLTLLTLLFAVGMSAQTHQIVLCSAKGHGSTLTFYPTQVNTADKVFVDWGDGNRQEYTVIPNGWGSDKRVSGAVKGDTVRVFCNLKKLDVADNSLSYLGIRNQPSLEYLDANHNQLTKENLDIANATALTYLDLSHNDVLNLNLSAMQQLENVYVNHNPRFNTIIFAEGLSTLKQVKLNNTDLVHFYPNSLPNLQQLDVSNCSLAELETGDNYPKLTTLKVSGNAALTELELNNLPALYDLDISHTAISQLNVSYNKELVILNVRHTPIKALDLQNNTNLTTLDFGNTQITAIDLTKLPRISRLAADSTALTRLDLSRASYLNDVNVRNTGIEFLDMHGCIGYNLLKRLDMRDCKNMTPQTLNFTFSTMPEHQGRSWAPNVLIAGSNGEHSNTSILSEDSDTPYKTDIQGDGTAPMDSVSISQETAVGGSYLLKQIGKSLSDDSWTLVNSKIKPGHPVRVEATPAAGYYFYGVTVNGKLYRDSIFVASSTATVQPQFRRGSVTKNIKLTVPGNAEQQYFLAANEDNTQITIDWGNGEDTPVTIHATSTLVQGTSKGTTITLKGNITQTSFDSFEGVGVENHISKLDVSGNDGLKSLSIYMNPITTLDLASNTELEQLDCAYCRLSTLDISANKKLKSLKAYGNRLTTIDLSGASELETCDVKNNQLTAIDFSNNPKLSAINVLGNRISSLNVSHLSLLESLEAQSNQLTAVDVTANTMLETLSLSGNQLASIDLSKNKRLHVLNLDACNIAVPDLSSNVHLQAVNISKNGWDACELNDFYYHLPLYIAIPSISKGREYTLWNEGNTHLAGNANATAHSETSIAVAKGWSVNAEGDGTGCNKVYLTVLPTRNGTVRLWVNGTETASGTTVPRNSEVTVVATPAAGSSLVSIAANSKKLVGNKFQAVKATDIAVQFTVPTKINGVKQGETSVVATRGTLTITTPTSTSVNVYAASGASVYQGTINGTHSIDLPQGIYIVRIEGVLRKIYVQ